MIFPVVFHNGTGLGWHLPASPRKQKRGAGAAPHLEHDARQLQGLYRKVVDMPTAGSYLLTWLL